MDKKKYLRDIIHNFNLAKEILNPDVNMSEIVRLIEKPKKIKNLEVGQSTSKINSDAMKVMNEFFKYDELPKWMN